MLPVRLAQAGLDVVPHQHVALLAYLQHLAVWNRTINLTAFDLDEPTPAAIDRLVVEPLIAARHISETDRVLIDIGSGAGSPAVLIKIAAPWLRVVLVESKTRKATFLRDVIRHLGLQNTRVENLRAEKLQDQAELSKTADVVSLRAVALDESLSIAIRRLMKTSGRLFWFSNAASPGPAWHSVARDGSLTILVPR